MLCGRVALSKVAAGVGQVLRLTRASPFFVCRRFVWGQLARVVRKIPTCTRACCKRNALCPVLTIIARNVNIRKPITLPFSTCGKPCIVQGNLSQEFAADHGLHEDKLQKQMEVADNGSCMCRSRSRMHSGRSTLGFASRECLLGCLHQSQVCVLFLGLVVQRYWDIS